MAESDSSLSERVSSEPRWISRRVGASCLPAVPAGVGTGGGGGGGGLGGPLQRGAGVLGRLLSLRGARIQQGWEFLGVEGPGVVLGPGRPPTGPVVRHPPEVLGRSVSALVVAGVEVIATSSLGVRVSGRSKVRIRGALCFPEAPQQQPDGSLDKCSETSTKPECSNTTEHWVDSVLTCRSRAGDPGGPGRCCTGRTVFSGGSCCCGSPPSCGTSLRGSAGPSSGPCSGAGRRGDAGPLAKTGCCFLGTCTYGPSASLLGLEHSGGWGGWCLRFGCLCLLFYFAKHLHLNISPL